MRGKILLVDDQPERLQWFAGQIDEMAARTPGLGVTSKDVVYAQSGPEALALLAELKDEIRVAVVDLSFDSLPADKKLLGPDASREGMHVARRIRELVPALSVYIFTMTGDEVEPLDARTHVVPFDHVVRLDIVSVVLQLLAESRPADGRRALTEDMAPSLRRAPGIDYFTRLARGGAPVLLLGETGVGKSTLAEWLHRASGRPGPFVVFDCAGRGGDPNILRSALFGHRKRFVPGMDTERVGAVEEADGGTLFLDEIAELPEDLQTMLLRVLREKKFSRLGEEPKERTTSFRLISATDRLAKTMRAALLGRLGIAQTLPPLRDRPEDIRWFVDRVLVDINDKRAKNKQDRLWVDEATYRVLEAYEWPQNAGELHNAMEVAAVMADGGVIRVENLPAVVQQGAGVGGTREIFPPSATFTVPLAMGWEAIERRYFLTCWDRAMGIHRNAAKLARAPNSTVWRGVLRAGVALLAQVYLEHESLEQQAAGLGLSKAGLARLVDETQKYLLKQNPKRLDLAGRATELEIEPERLARLIEAVRTKLGGPPPDPTPGVEPEPF
jgi:DNA-binding NtrC family response regulator